MTKLILSTSNIMGTGPSILRRFTEKSNIEFTSALRANLESAQKSIASVHDTHADWKNWTRRSENTVFIPSHDFEEAGLGEERSAYDITVKLFFLPNNPASCRCAQTRSAIKLVLNELKVPYIDLLIISYPGLTFDAEDEDNGDHTNPDSIPGAGAESNSGAGHAEDIDTMIETWQCLEDDFHGAGVIKKLGVSEFGTERLTKFLKKARVRPTVDQINVRDCCVVPRDLILFAKQEKVELLTHNDCTNILPAGTLRELLRRGNGGFGILAGEDEEDGIKGNVEPQWVVKYTAVVKDRGVIENKGYFAMAEVLE